MRVGPILLGVAALLIAAAGVALATGAVRVRSAATLNGGVLETPFPAPEFTLTSANGPASLASYRGKVVLLFFGYTNCPDVCPTTLAQIATVKKQLSPEEAAKVQLIFVTVDPERDTAAVVDSYARKFDPTYLGLTGTPDQVLAVAKQYGIAFETTAKDASGFFFVNHSAYTIVIDAAGNARELLVPDMGNDAIAADLRTLTRT